MVELAISSFVTLFVVIDPLGMVPLFMSVMPGTNAAGRRKTALRGTLAASGILVVSAFAGSFVLDSLGITLAAFRIAGGILLLLAIDMVLARMGPPSHHGACRGNRGRPASRCGAGSVGDSADRRPRCVRFGHPTDGARRQRSAGDAYGDRRAARGHDHSFGSVAGGIENHGPAWQNRGRCAGSRIRDRVGGARHSAHRQRNRREFSVAGSRIVTPSYPNTLLTCRRAPQGAELPYKSSPPSGRAAWVRSAVPTTAARSAMSPGE